MEQSFEPFQREHDILLYRGAFSHQTMFQIAGFEETY